MTNAEYLRELRSKAVARGLCQMCRCRFPRPGVKSCDDCLSRKAAREASNRARRRCGCGRELFGRWKQCAKRRADRRAWASTRPKTPPGVCIRCERMPSAPARASCFECLDKSAEAVRERYSRLRKPGAPKRVTVCSVCGGDHNRRRHERGGS